MGPASADDHDGIGGAQIRPLLREPAELSCVVVKEDAILAPRGPALDQLEDAPVQRMERMRDVKGLWRTTRQRCNRWLTPTGWRSDSCAPFARSVSTGY